MSRAAKRAREATDEEALRAARIATAIEGGVPFCRVCGCTDERACPGGCIWAESNLCSRCARAVTAMARSLGGAA